MNPSLVAGFRTIFVETYQNTPLVLDDFIERVESNAASEDYGMLGAFPQVRRMDGERRPKQLGTSKFTIENEEWEATLEISYKDLKFNRLADKNLIVRAMARNARRFPQRLAMDLIIANGIGYDGQNFFDTDHEEGESGTQSNVITAGSGAVDETNLSSALASLATFKDEAGEVKYEDVEAVVLVNPADAVAARKLLVAQQGSNGSTNVMEGTAKLVVSGRVPTNRWYVANVGAGVKPIIYQEAEFIEFEALENRPDANNHESFMRKKNYYGPYILANAGYGDWRTMVEVRKS